MSNIASSTGGLARWVPILRWLPAYRREWLAADGIAGLTIWGLLIPEMIAYASLAGLSPQTGLYTLLATLGLYAIFGTSRQLVVAGTSATAVLVFSTVTQLDPSDPDRYAALAEGMILLTGVVLVVAGMLRLGFITQFLSRPVMAGFVFGLAIFVTVSQLPKIFGVEKGEGNTISQLLHLLAELGSTSGVTLAVGAGALALLFGLERWVPRIPGGLVVLVLGIALSALLDLSSHGVAIVGDIPSGLPSVAVPDIALGDLWVLLPAAVGMMLVIFSEALGAGTTFADKHGYRIDSNQEMIALGVANLGSSLLGGLAGGGSLSQTAVNDGAGARSQLSSLIAAGLSLVTVIALTPLFADLPEAVLAALIIHALSHLMKVRQLIGFHHLSPQEFWLGIMTLGGVIVFDVLPGLILGVVISILLFVYRASQPKVSILGRTPNGEYVDVDRNPEGQTIPGVLVVRPDAPLFYANAQSVRDDIEGYATVADSGIRSVVIDLDSNDDLDITSAENLDKLADSLHRDHIHLRIAHLHQPARVIAAEIGLLDKIGEANVHPNIESAVQAADTGASDAGP